MYVSVVYKLHLYNWCGNLLLCTLTYPAKLCTLIYWSLGRAWPCPPKEEPWQPWSWASPTGSHPSDLALVNTLLPVLQLPPLPVQMCGQQTFNCEEGTTAEREKTGNESMEMGVGGSGWRRERNAMTSGLKHVNAREFVLVVRWGIKSL